MLRQHLLQEQEKLKTDLVDAQSQIKQLKSTLVRKREEKKKQQGSKYESDKTKRLVFFLTLCFVGSKR